MTQVLTFQSPGHVVQIRGGGGYRLELDWVPNVSERTASMIGGRSQYARVVERINMQVRGDATAVGNLVRDLQLVMAIADRFFHEEQGGATTITINMGVTSWTCLMLRSIGGGVRIQPGAMLALEQDDVVVRLELVFERRGLWLRAYDELVEAASTANSEAVINLPIWSGSNTPVFPAPYKFEWRITRLISPPGLVSWKMLLIAGTGGDLHLFTAVGGAFSGSTVAEAGAIGGRAVSIVTGSPRTVTVSRPARWGWHVFAKIKHTSPTTSATVEVSFGVDAAHLTPLKTVVCDPLSVDVYYLGVVRSEADINVMRFDNTTGSGTVLMDSVLLVRDSDRVAVNWFETTTSEEDTVAVIDARPLSALCPSLSEGVSGESYHELGEVLSEAVAYGCRKTPTTSAGALHYVDEMGGLPKVGLTVGWWQAAGVPL